MGRGLCAAAVGVLRQIQTTINTYAHLSIEDMGERSSVIKRSVSNEYQGWLNRTAQLQLISELKGFWAGDLWDMHYSPVKDLSPNAKQRCSTAEKSAALNGELKYLCWKKFLAANGGALRKSPVFIDIHWLNSMRTVPSPPAKGLTALARPLSVLSVRAGTIQTGTTSRMDGEQRPQVSSAATVRSSALCGRLASCLDRPTIFALISRKTSGI